MHACGKLSWGWGGGGGDLQDMLKEGRRKVLWVKAKMVYPANVFDSRLRGD